MTPQRYAQVRALFLAARDVPASQRGDFLSVRCAGDDELRREVESLLGSAAAADTFLTAPALGREFRLEDVAPRSGLDSTLARGRPPSGLSVVLERVGSYRILDVIGEGGMGVVYRAEQESPRRIVALKVIRPGAESAEALQRFEHEGQVLAWLQHPGIAQVYETGTADIGGGRRPFFAMEYIEGRSLCEHAAAVRLTVRQRLELLARLADAVQHAHQKGVVHRDLKPANILVDPTGQPKIVDFGVARVTEADLRLTTLRTDAGRLIGTLAYMSPEQLAGDPREVDTRADVYALGVIAYELLTGRTPIDVTGRSLPEAARAVAEREPPPLRSQNRALRGDVETIVAKAMEKDKGRRYQSAADLAADLRRYLADQPIAARPATVIYQFRKFARRNRALVAGVALALLALLGGTAGTTFGLLRARAQQAAAEAERNRVLDAEVLAARRLQEAESEAAKATAINAFIRAMLSSADPEREGREVRVVDVLQRAAQDLERELRNQPEIEAALRNTIGVTYMGLGLNAEAEPHLRTALALRVDLLGPEHADTLSSMANLGLMLVELRRPDDGRALLGEVLTTRQRTLGAEHPETVLAMSNLAHALQRAGEVRDAEAWWREALDIQRRISPPDDPQRAVLLNNLAQLLKQTRRAAAAEPLLREALAIQRAARGDEHPHTLAAMDNLAMTLKALDESAEAEALLREVVATRRRTLGEHPALYVALSNLARVLQDQDRLEEAEPLAREALEGFRRSAGPDSRKTLVAENNLASLLVDLGRAPDAAALYVELIDAARRVLPADDFTLQIFARNYGRCLTALRRFEEAEALLVPSHDGLVRTLGARHEHTHKTLTYVIELYEAWGKPDAAAAYRAQLK